MLFLAIPTMAVLLSGASAHLIMKAPKPWLPTDGTLLSPLDSPQAFPCKFGPNHQYSMENPTKLVAGASTPLAFKGSAVHGGGSCQVSLSKTASADPKDWKVIHSIIGGCPGTNGPGGGLDPSKAGGMDNLKELDKSLTLTSGADSIPCKDADTDELNCLKKYDVPIPKELATGLYFFAWTWFNKQGNREMYMNCAPVEVTGGSASDEFLAKQPSIFYANVNSQPCITTSGYSIDFPAPGNSVLRSTNQFDMVSPKALGVCSGLYPPQSSDPAHIAHLKPTTGANAPVPSDTDAPTTSTPAPIPHTTASPPTISAPDLSPPASSLSNPPSSSASTSPAPGCATPCPEDGKVICIAPDRFGICNQHCVTPQALAAGTRCLNGAIVGMTGRRHRRDRGRAMGLRRAALR